MLKSILVLIARLVTGANIQWAGCAPSARQRIYFANHSSNLDAVVIWASLPPDLRELTRPVAARDYWTKSKLRRYLADEIFHAVLIERMKPTAEANPLVDMLSALGDRHSLIIFPEGGRQLSPQMAPFKGGLFHLARSRPDVELVPVFIGNLNRILPKGEFLLVPLLCSLTFGAPIRLEEGEDKRAFLNRARSAVEDLQNI